MGRLALLEGTLGSSGCGVDVTERRPLLPLGAGRTRQWWATVKVAPPLGTFLDGALVFVGKDFGKSGCGVDVMERRLLLPLGLAWTRQWWATVKVAPPLGTLLDGALGFVGRDFESSGCGVDVMERRPLLPPGFGRTNENSVAKEGAHVEACFFVSDSL